jgi:hypothetical protein
VSSLLDDQDVKYSPATANRGTFGTFGHGVQLRFEKRREHLNKRTWT